MNKHDFYFIYASFIAILKTKIKNSFYSVLLI